MQNDISTNILKNAQFLCCIFIVKVKKGMCSADDLENVLGNISVEVWNNLNFVKNMLKKSLLLNFIPMKFNCQRGTERNFHFIKL
jgi:hypothetical protein